MSLTQNIEELISSKIICESSSLNFTRYFYKQRFNKKFIIGEHHLKIAETLDKVISGEIKKLIINIAPRYGKTELAVKNFMAYGLAINPSARFIHLSYSDDLALDNSEEVREIVSSEEYKQMFPRVKIKPKSDAKKKWYTTENGGVYATSTAGQVTGFGAGQVDNTEFDDDFLIENNSKFAGALIIDDPIKPEDADSEVIRNRINERWDSTIKNRVNSRNTPIIIIMQRLHEEDLCGYLLAQSPDEWTVLSFPCIREDNTSLWPFKHTVEELEKLREENEVVFERQYQQKPMPLKGLLFHRDKLKFFSMKDFKWDGCESILGFIDVADEGTDSLAFVIGSVFMNKVFITDVIFTNENIDISAPSCIGMIESYKTKAIDWIRVETNNQGGGFIREVRRSYNKFIGVPTKSNKHSRILIEQINIYKYFYFRNDYAKKSDYDKFMNELFGYMKDGTSSHDDAPDSLCGLSKFCLSFLPHLFK